MAVRVAVDAMGGDHAPGVVVEGAIRALRAEPGRLRVTLFGPEATVREALAAHGTTGLDLAVADAPDVIGMGESPSAALKGKPRSSIHLGLGAVRSGAADAFASAGNTGAVMAAALVLLGRLPGVLRPTIPGIFPTTEGRCVVLDVGANVDCRPEHLVQFAQMGRVYAERLLGVAAPRVALVNVGEEPGKGNDLVKAAYERMTAERTPGFVGNVEGRDLLRHGADVAVCDGFVGNALLKLAESVAVALPQMIRREVARQGLADAEAALVGRVLRGTLAPFDYENLGGVPLLGVDGAVVIGHGDSAARAIEQMLLRVVEVVEQGIAARIAEALAAPRRPATAPLPDADAAPAA